MLAAMAATAVAGSDESPDLEAKAHYERGTAAYTAGDWSTAIQEFKAAYAAAPRPEHLFAMGQAYRRSGDCASAVPLYQSYLKSAPHRQAEPIARLIEGCQAELEKAKVEVSPEPEPEPEAQPVEEDPDAEAERRAVGRGTQFAAPTATRVLHWYQDPLGDTLAVMAVAAVGVGTTFLVMGNSRMSQAPSLTTYGAYQSASLSARPQQLIGLSALGGAVLLALGATWRYVSLSARSPVVALVAQPSGATLAVGGSF
jgi:hypothetical protein